MNIVIKTRKQHPVSDEKLYELYKASYQQWLEAGVDAQWLHHTLESFKNLIEHTIVYIAIEESSQELLGMHCLNINHKRKGIFGICLAVAPQYKQQGIATKLLLIESQQVRQRGFNYMKGVTEVSAIWSVRWHLKNGYHIVGYSRSENSNCASYTFRKQIATDIRHHPSDILWLPFLAPISAKISFVISYLITIICKTRSGKLNAIGRLVKRIRK